MAQVGDEQYWRCMDGMGHIADNMIEKGFNAPENANRFWCMECEDWVAPIPIVGKAACPMCICRVYTPENVKAWEAHTDGRGRL